MQRIDNTTAAGSLPTPASAGTPGYFTGGNPATAMPATIVDADWLNMIQEELIAVVTAASLSPSKTTHNQVLAAITALISAGGGRPGHTYTANDWCWLDKAAGLILQWGSVGGASGANVHVTFPTTFPNTCLGVTLAPTITSLGTGVTGGAINENTGYTPNASGMYWYCNAVAPQNSYYFALGN